MSSSRVDRARRRILGRSKDWVKKFDVNDYVNRPEMIEKLHEEKQMWLARVMDLEEEVTSLSNQLHDSELRGQRLDTTLRHTRQQSSTVFGMALISTILMGIGVNLVTGGPYVWVGCVMIAASAALQLLAFAAVLRLRD